LVSSGKSTNDCRIGEIIKKKLACEPELLFLHRVSPVRPAPAELPQDRKIARVGGCSGAMQVAYPFLFLMNTNLDKPEKTKDKRQIISKF